MATVTGLTSARMQQIADASVVDGDIVGDDLILTKRDSSTINAGNVRGAQGSQGPMGIQGPQGLQGPGGWGNWLGADSIAYNPAHAYIIDDLTTGSDGSIYICVADCTGVNPVTDTDQSNWVSTLPAGILTDLRLGWFDVKKYGAKGDNSTDDTAAIQSAIDTCIASGGGVIFFPAGIYVVDGPLITTYHGQTFNSQLCVWSTGHTQNPIEFVGVSPCGQINKLPDLNVRVSILKSTRVVVSGNYPCMLSTPFYGAQVGGADITVRSHNMLYRCPTNPQLTAVDFSGACSAYVDEIRVDVGETYLSATEPTHTNSRGLVMPGARDVMTSSATGIGKVAVQGYYCGLEGSDHLSTDQYHAVGCVVAFSPVPADGYGSVFQYLGVWRCKYGIAHVDENGLADTPIHSAYARVKVALYQSENVNGQWHSRIYDVYDTNAGNTGDRLYVDIGFGYQSGAQPGFPKIKGYRVNWWYVGYGGRTEQWLLDDATDFLNGWHSPGYPNYVGLRLDRNGYVHLSGVLTAGVLGQPAFSLPRPFKAALYNTGRYMGFCFAGGRYKPAVIFVNTNDIQPDSTAEDGTIYLNGISWPSSDREIKDPSSDFWPPM